MSKWKIATVACVVVVGLLVARPFVFGPTKIYERSVACNFPGEFLEATEQQVDLSKSDCFVIQQVDNWYYVVGEFGWFVADTEVLINSDAVDVFARIGQSETELSKDYGRYCEALILETVRTNRERLKTIASTDARGQFSISCPAEEASDAA
ncbi:hypothetical protein [uncultured Roseobacter sp.]|uniref:hypothetical protein n=1 Tax=uncultured Roseobacter sp. TaxID=114847 RepID=UPI00262F4E1E|nr:hypothetical protein [uncultured Roseobacter sp.]